jgi:hypothetical protein
MKDFVDQVEAASSVAQLYYLALAGALIIPDLGGALGSGDGRATGARYKAWYDTNLPPSFLSGADCYRFRCSFLHQGSTQHTQSSYSRIVFVEPGASNAVLHMNIMNDALNIDVKTFCQEMVLAARNWIAQVSGTQPYEANLLSFVTRYPSGLAPYIGGVPVIS